MYSTVIWYEILVEKTVTASLSYNMIRGHAPFFSHHGLRQQLLRSGQTTVGTPFQTEYPPSPGASAIMAASQTNIYLNYYSPYKSLMLFTVHKINYTHFLY